MIDQKTTYKPYDYDRMKANNWDVNNKAGFAHLLNAWHPNLRDAAERIADFVPDIFVENATARVHGAYYFLAEEVARVNNAYPVTTLSVLKRIYDLKLEIEGQENIEENWIYTQLVNLGPDNIVSIDNSLASAAKYAKSDIVINTPEA